MTTRLRNIYSELPVEEPSFSEPKDLKRKAEKKLREIENLKQKSNPTSEEQEKISQEKYWRNILYTEEKQQYSSNDKESSTKRKKKEAEQKHKKAKQEKHRRRHEKKQKEEEERKKQQRRYEKSYVPAKEIEEFYEEQHIHTTIFNKYLSLSSEKGYNKAFRELSILYHPDKNSSTEATLHFQLLNNIHEEYSKQKHS
jgi:hypothetical protein